MALGHVGVALHLSGGFGPSDIAGLASLLVLPFAHEDLAIVFGACAIVNKWLPASLVGLSIYGGTVASDFALYGIGAGARRLPWLSRFAVDDRVHRVGQNLRRNIFGLFALCRLVPGVVFVAFVACGWTRVPLARFTVASLLISALYLPITLYLMIVFGDALDDHFGLWGWPVLLAVIVATAFVRRHVFTFGKAGEADGLALHDDLTAGRYRRLRAQQRFLCAKADAARNYGFKPVGAAQFLDRLVRRITFTRPVPPST